MSVKTIKLNKSGGPVEIDVLIGQAQFGEYTVTLYDQNGKSPVVS